MRPTLKQLVSKFHHFNHLIFGDKLPLPEIRQTTDIYRAGCTTSQIVKLADGTVTRTGWTILISIRFDSPESHYDNVLVHEMIHYYIGYNNLQDDGSHGHLFVRFMNRINEKFGMDIQVRGVFSDTDISQLSPRQRFFCAVEMKDGQLAFGVIAKNKVREVWDLLDRRPEIENVTWYSSYNPRLGICPIASGPSLHFVDRETLDLFLKDSIKLVR